MALKEVSTLTTNGVIDLYLKKGKRARLTIEKLDRNTVLIEGSAKALEFLGRYLIAHSRADDYDCGVQLSPKGPGSAWFTKTSTLGIYLHRLPCREHRKPHRRAGARRAK